MPNNQVISIIIDVPINKCSGHEFCVIIPSCDRNLANGAAESLSPIKSSILDGAGYPSFSKLINDCIIQSPTELIVVSNDKARASVEHIQKMFALLDGGYSLVGLYRFGFFGFYKEVIRRIGFFDEKYIGGGYEDCDIVRRLKESNLSYYESEEIPYISMESRWTAKFPNGASYRYFHSKWEETSPCCSRRLIAEEKYNYDIGQSTGRQFLPWSHSILMAGSGSFLTSPML